MIDYIRETAEHRYTTIDGSKSPPGRWRNFCFANPRSIHHPLIFRAASGGVCNLLKF